MKTPLLGETNPPVPQTSEAQLSGTMKRVLCTPVFDGSPLPPYCDQSPVKNRPVRITGDRFPGDIKEQRVKQKEEKKGINQSFLPAREWILRLIIS